MQKPSCREGDCRGSRILERSLAEVVRIRSSLGFEFGLQSRMRFRVNNRRWVLVGILSEEGKWQRYRGVASGFI